MTHELPLTIINYQFTLLDSVKYQHFLLYTTACIDLQSMITDS
jgi:hypothetical protein